MFQVQLLDDEGARRLNQSVEHRSSESGLQLAMVQPKAQQAVLYLDQGGEGVDRVCGSQTRVLSEVQVLKLDALVSLQRCQQIRGFGRE